jgi:hypothetical protein
MVLFRIKPDSTLDTAVGTGGYIISNAFYKGVGDNETGGFTAFDNIGNIFVDGYFMNSYVGNFIMKYTDSCLASPTGTPTITMTDIVPPATLTATITETLNVAATATTAYSETITQTSTETASGTVLINSTTTKTSTMTVLITKTITYTLTETRTITCSNTQTPIMTNTPAISISATSIIVSVSTATQIINVGVTVTATITPGPAIIASELSAERDTLAFPNPIMKGAGTFSVQYDLGGASLVRFLLYSISYRLILDEAFTAIVDNGNGNKTGSMPASVFGELTNGVYYYVLMGIKPDGISITSTISIVEVIR